MNLVIDAGNTLTKIAIFSDNEIKSSFSSEKLSVDVLKSVLQENTAVKNIILSSVVEHDTAIPDFLRSNYHFVELTQEVRLPVGNQYKSPHTLGKDRLASAVGVNFLYRGQNALSVDMGTCIKYDFVNAQNQYLGGGISPGIEMRFKALNKFTDKLPLIAFRSYDDLIGSNTEESILSGVINGVAEELKGIIHRYEQQYPGVKVVFTGGQYKFGESIFNIVGKGKSNIFADPFLVLKGLNHILNFNEKK